MTKIIKIGTQTNTSNMKKSAYQKLKDENLALKQDLYVLTMMENSDDLDDILKVFSVRFKWKSRFEFENKIWQKR